MALLHRCLTGIASVSALAILVVSCKDKLAEADLLDLASAPVQTIDDVFAVQTRNGKVLMRMEAALMNRYDNDSLTYESFPNGMAVYAYTDDGVLETIIVSDDARHSIGKKGYDKQEVWAAFGNVIVRNVEKQETMETDTLYWDQSKNEIYTHCYVKMYSPQGFMQGYGMRSDDHAREAVLQNPFNSYGVTVQDSTVVVVDSVNFIGPLLKK